MQVSDFIGSTGVAMILAAYFLNSKGKLPNKKPLYMWLNFVGASLACTASYMIAYWPFVVLEGAWAAVSLQSLASSWKKGGEG